MDRLTERGTIVPRCAGAISIVEVARWSRNRGASGVLITEWNMAGRRTAAAGQIRNTTREGCWKIPPDMGNYSGKRAAVAGATCSFNVSSANMT